VARLERQGAAEQEQLAAALGQKADREEVARLERQGAAEQEQLAAALAAKADARVIDEIKEQKANSDWVHHLEINKAEARALNDLETRYVELAAHVQHSGEILADLERQINILFDEVSHRGAEVPPEPEEQRATPEHETWNGRLYAAFEDQFRGATEDIKSRESIYLPYIKKSASRGAKHPVIDIGCGRGEWLELLRENGLPASGVDSNRTMIKRCLDLGLNVAEADGVEYLRSLRPRSAVAITAFHVVEHLPIPKLLGLLAQAFRVLRPGGRLILETPNPANVLVGSCNFYLDPTHIRPLPPALLRFLVQTRGFADVEIQELHPMPEHMRLVGSDVAERLNQHFYGAQDYAVLAGKPITESGAVLS
jgi:O-antigen chain-terminating methyltransferase